MEVLTGLAVGATVVVAILFALNFREGVRTRRAGWSYEALRGPGSRAGWRWQDRRMRR